MDSNLLQARPRSSGTEITTIIGAVLRAMGAREILSGVGILTPRNPTAGLWSRVAGDAMDLGLLGVAAARTRNRKMVAGAIAMVAAISALDLLYARRLQRSGAAT